MPRCSDLCAHNQEIRTKSLLLAVAVSQPAVPVTFTAESSPSRPQIQCVLEPSSHACVIDRQVSPRERRIISALERKLQCYTTLLDADRVWLADALKYVRSVGAHTDIAVEGDDPRAVHVILEGWAGRCRHLPDGRRQITSLLLPGDCCDPHVFMFKRRDHTITTLTPVVVASIPGPVFQALEARSPNLERAFFFEIMITLSIQREVAVNLGRRSGIERFAHLFCELHARLTAVGLAEGAECPMPLNQNDLADTLGQTSVHINRLLQELRSQGLISLRSRRLTIHNAGGLARLAQFDPTYLHTLDDAWEGEKP